MGRKKEITVKDLNSALRHISMDARRKNKALGLETLYESDGYLIKEDAYGKKEKLKKLNKKNGEASLKIVTID